MAQREYRKRFVLAVEDNVDEVDLLRKAFERTGFAECLKTAACAEEATDYVLGRNSFADRDRFPLPSLVLLDLNLPGKSGIQFLEWYRSRPESKGVPVVMLTSSVGYADVKSAFGAGATSYIIKPTGFDALVDALRTVLTYWLVMNTPL